MNRYFALTVGVLITIWAAAVIWKPVDALAFAVGILLLVLGFHSLASPQHFFLAALGLLLTGYAFLGKGFAYLPARPIFVGEIVLFLGLLTALAGGKVRLAFRSPLSWVLLAFAVDGALCTIPYMRADGLNALRDAVIWGYSAFAVLVAAFVLQLGCFRRVIESYGRWFRWLLFCLPLTFLIQAFARRWLLIVSRSPTVTIPDLLPGDIGVSVAGIGCFMALQLHRSRRDRAGHGEGPKDLLWWILWLFAAAIAGLLNRGALLAILLAITLAICLRPFRGWGKPFALSVLLAAVAFAGNVSISTGGGRKISIRQLTANLESVVGEGTPNSTLLANRRWRLEWWGEILNYTFFGKYFWTGKGFGINLADSDGFQVQSDHSLRSPHDASATILARMGVPGLLLWLLLQGVFGFCLLRAYFRAHSARQEWWARVDLWILAYWTAAIVTMTFGVYLEGPQGGIWFWSLFGFGIAALELQRGLPRRMRHVLETHLACSSNSQSIPAANGR